MKNIVLVAALLIATCGASFAENKISGALKGLSEMISKVAVRPEDLPEAVKSTLASSYSEWKVTSAFLVTKEDNSQYYEVNIKKTEETSTVNFDKYGKKLD